MLQVENLVAGYGTTRILHGISFDVSEGECVALVGANGAGKTTTLRALCGIVKPTSGNIVFEGQSIIGLKASRIPHLGLTMCPEGRQVFSDMSVEENLRIGAFRRNDREIHSDLQKMYETFPVLKERRDQKAGTLSGGEQEMLAIGRALMSRPKLCIFDEPSLGLAPKIVTEVEQTIAQIKKQGTTILLVEQNASMALRLADRAYVYESGNIVLGGAADELANDPKVKQAYFGF